MAAIATKYTNQEVFKNALVSNYIRSKDGIGSTPVSTVKLSEYTTGKDVVTVLELTDFVVGTLAGAVSLGLGNIVYTFPAGQHFELVYGFSDLSLKCAGDAEAADTGLGSVVASGAVAVLSGTGTFEDRLTGQAVTTDPAGGTAVSKVLAATAGIGTGISLNATNSVKDVFLNAAGSWAAANIGQLTASGLITIKWTIMN